MRVIALTFFVLALVWCNVIHAKVSLTPVTLQLKWFHGWQFAGYYAAQKKGFYQQQGLKVTIKQRNIGTSHIDDVLSGKAQYGIADASLVLHRLQGKPVVALAAIFQHSPLVLITLAKSKIRGPLELKNKRVMYQKGIDGAAISSIFLSQGLGLDYFKYVPHSFNDQDLLTGKVDAISAYLTSQVISYQAQGIKLNIIDPINYGVDFYGDTLFTTEQELKQHPEQVKAFTQASIKGWHYALTHIDEVNQWLKSDYQQHLSKEILTLQAKAYQRMILPDLVDIGYLNPQRYQRIAQVYKQLNMADSKATLDGILVSDHQKTPRSVKRQLLILITALLIVTAILLVVIFINRRLNQLVKERTQALYEQSVTDYLTGLNNRKHLDLVLASEIERSERYAERFSVLIIDIDHFKRVNDNFGHLVGDKVLVALAKLLLSLCRKSDVLGRWGGEEFLLICPNLSTQAAVKFAEKIRQNVSEYNFELGQALHVSIGISTIIAGDDLYSIIKRADNALYYAKEHGRNQVKYFDHSQLKPH